MENNTSTEMISTTEETNVSSSTNPIESMGVNLLEIPEFKASLLIWRYCPPVLLLLGGLGNVATIFVLRRMDWGQSAQHVFLTALALVDLGLLYTGLLRQWILHVLYTDVRLFHSLTCKLHLWFVYSLNNSSAWLITAVTVQRAMSVIWPCRISAWCTRKRSRFFAAILVTVSFVLHSEKLVRWEVRDGLCTLMPGMEDADHIWEWVDLLSASLLPTTILLFCNVFLAVTLRRSARQVIRLGSGQNLENCAYIVSRRKVARSTTVMLMSLSVTFILLTLPVCVFLLCDTYAGLLSTKDTHLLARMLLTWGIVNILWYANTAVNFLLYCVTGTKFRRGFVSWITCNRIKSTGGEAKDRRSRSLVYAVSSGSTATVEVSKV